MPPHWFERRRWNDADPYVALLSRQVPIDAEVEDALRTCLGEVCQNVEDHSRSDVGGVACGRFAEREGVVGVTVVDLGVGVLASLQPRYPSLGSDHDALRAVLTASITSRSTARNLGQGLASLRAICTGRRGRVVIASGSALAEATDVASEPRLRTLPARFPGTIVHFGLPVAPGDIVAGR